MNLSDPLELQGSMLYTVGRNGLVNSFVVPTGEEQKTVYGVQSQTRDLVASLVTLGAIAIAVFVLLQFGKR